MRLTLDPTITAALPSGDLVIRDVIATGIIERADRPVPLYDSIFLKDECGGVFAGAIIFDVDGTLYGFQVTTAREISLFTLPPAIRVIRPIRHVVS